LENLRKNRISSILLVQQVSAWVRDQTLTCTCPHGLHLPTNTLLLKMVLKMKLLNLGNALHTTQNYTKCINKESYRFGKGGRTEKKIPPYPGPADIVIK